MRRLPAFTFEGFLWALPLADRSAMVLADLLLAEDREASVQGLAERMRQDPPLVLWAVGRAFQYDRLQPRSVADAAQWLADHALEVLRWEPATTGGYSLAMESEESEVWADRVAESLAAASLAASLVRSDDEAAKELAYLSGLLLHADQWRTSVAADNRAASTAWPALVPQDMGASKEAVAEAVELLAGRRTAESSRCDPEARRQWAAQGRQAWLEQVPGIGTHLPALVDRLSRLKELEQQFQEALEREKLESLAEFAAGAGHEINNPLAIIAGRAQLFMKSEPDPERRRELALMNAQAQRAHEMIADMRLFARPPRPECQIIDLAVLVEHLAAELAPQLAERSIRLSRTGDPGPLEVEADPVQLSVAIHALAKNSLEAIGQEGEIEIALYGSENMVEIRVSDNGPGILPEHRPHLFDPFFSARQAGRGLGLGLSKCWRIVTNHGGRIRVEGRPGEGAIFTITLPRRQAFP